MHILSLAIKLRQKFHKPSNILFYITIDFNKLISTLPQRFQQTIGEHPRGANTLMYEHEATNQRLELTFCDFFLRNDILAFT